MVTTESTPYRNTNWSPIQYLSSMEDSDEILMEEMEMIGRRRRRSLDEEGRTFISYGALKGDIVPCNLPGSSYYDCGRSGEANPYRRACTAITNCARQTD